MTTLELGPLLEIRPHGFTTITKTHSPTCWINLQAELADSETPNPKPFSHADSELQALTTLNPIIPR